MSYAVFLCFGSAVTGSYIACNPQKICDRTRIGVVSYLGGDKGMLPILCISSKADNGFATANKGIFIGVGIYGDKQRIIASPAPLLDLEHIADVISCGNRVALQSPLGLVHDNLQLAVRAQ